MKLFILTVMNGLTLAALYFLVMGLMGPVLIGQLTPEAALDLLDHQLARIFRPSAP